MLYLSTLGVIIEISSYMCIAESRSSTSEMLPSHSSRKESTYSVNDDDVFSTNELKKNNDVASK